MVNFGISHLKNVYFLILAIQFLLFPIAYMQEIP